MVWLDGGTPEGIAGCCSSLGGNFTSPAGGGEDSHEELKAVIPSYWGRGRS